ncbi:MAG TPA: bifunctional DNA-formamidopyrimidine glycosylase/DNA-(apurinic or apyrimidinic site) lyase [Leucothrix mucor]|uniref:Formamidopyrimidine-DNA glycosylase n=1 Tax=Leucothrix mucor TaxID=45248 RepID=A0A7V2T2A1_LEUMU|nr:bifunctional DNA-formamidopyrimidine glycosylase/DNA-(apurinic or apyrimidinic site) lyase [Leucothrix mucor]
MPELPEVETTRRGIAPYIEGKIVKSIIIRQAKLRWPVPDSLHELEGRKISSVTRRAKYLLLQSAKGCVILHLGMSGSLRIIDASLKAEKHDHIDIILATGKALRLHDPRRFGAVLWTTNDPLQHTLLSKLGPEPLSDAFHAPLLYKVSQKRRVSIKQFIMNAQIVVGVGNIYASESLFMAGISPKTMAGRMSLRRYEKLVEAIKIILVRAIEQGGTTLRDFVQAEGKPGYFQQQLHVYGRAGEECPVCHSLIKKITQGQRSSFYCSKCQT